MQLTVRSFDPEAVGPRYVYLEDPTIGMSIEVSFGAEGPGRRRPSAACVSLATTPRSRPDRVDGRASLRVPAVRRADQDATHRNE
jgi:hypothetical protein